MTICKTELLVTERGNDPADHPHDARYQADLRVLVETAEKPEPKWRAALKRHTVTREQVEDAADTRPIWLKMFFHQKMQVVVAPPNGGKTTICMQAAADITALGFDVYYFNLDAGLSDLKYYEAKASSAGFSLISPMGEATEQQVTGIIDLMLGADDLSNEVIFLDTLKKFANVISKDSAEFYKKLRALTRKGCTVIALGHSNKYPDKDGNLVYEGTGDLRADFDNLVFLYPVKNEMTGILTVSTDWKMEHGAKMRCDAKDATFEIHPDRSVTVSSDYFDAREELIKRRKEEDDALLIDAIREELAGGPKNQSVLVDALHQRYGVNHKTTRRILRDYTGRHWQAQRPFGDRNSWRYHL